MNDPRSGARTAVALVATALTLCTGLRAARAQDPAPEGTPSDVPGAEAPPPSPSSPPPAPPPPVSTQRLPPAERPPAEAEAVPPETSSWFDRAPFTLSTGKGDQKWSLTFYGFVEADYIADTTRSYNDSIGSALVARNDTYDGTVGRTQFSMRNTRLGLAFQSPTVGGVKPSAIIEGDFFGSQTAPPDGSEQTFYNSPTFRIRHAYVKLEDAYVDVIAGQTYDVFGWQNYFFPASVEFLGLPNMVFSRNTQLRLSHTFGADGPISLDVAVEAARPAQRDGQIPDVEGGLRLAVNGWKGITTPGNVRTIAMPLSIGVSAISRSFKVDAFTPPPTQTSNTVKGWGVSVDALVPVIPAADANDRGNRLTLTGSFVTGTGIADLLTTGGGATFPTLPNSAQQSPPPTYDPDIDAGLVTFDSLGVAHTINWLAFKAGLQYYLPPTGRLILSANYTESRSNNLKQLFPPGSSMIELVGQVADRSRYGDVNLFFDATPAVRIGVSGQYTQVHYLSNASQPEQQPHNIRGMGQVVYVF